MKIRRRGWSAIDLLVLLLVLLLAAGILVPLVVEQRKRAQRAHCAHNLQQLGKAIHRFNEAKGYLPPSRIADDYATWAVLIVPYLEKQRGQDTEHALVHWDAGKRYAEQPAELREALVRQMFCPSRERGNPFSIQGDGDPHLAGSVGDYACVSGDGRADRPWTGPKANGPMILGEVLQQDKGVIQGWRGRTQLDQKSLQRGLSCTLLLGEKHVPLDGFGQADLGDGCVYNGGRPASSARVAGPGFGLAESPNAPFASNFGGYHADVCLFLQADMALRPVTFQVTDEVLGRMTVRDEE